MMHESYPPGRKRFPPSSSSPSATHDEKNELLGVMKMLGGVFLVMAVLIGVGMANVWNMPRTYQRAQVTHRWYRAPFWHIDGRGGGYSEPDDGSHWDFLGERVPESFKVEVTGGTDTPVQVKVDKVAFQRLHLGSPAILVSQTRRWSSPSLMYVTFPQAASSSRAPLSP